MPPSLARLTAALALVATACRTAAPRTPVIAAPIVARPSPTALSVESLTAEALLARWIAHADARALLEAAVLGRLYAEAVTVAHPSNGRISSGAAEQGHALLSVVPEGRRRAFAQAMLLWLLQRAWDFDDATPVIREVIAVLGPGALDLIADACDRPVAPYGHTSLLLYANLASRDALAVRLLARARLALDAARTHLAETPRPDAQDPFLARVSTLLQALNAVDRPDPTQRFLLDVLADDAMPTRLRREALGRMTRTDLEFVAPRLVEIARATRDDEVAAAVISLLGAMIDTVPDAQLFALYEASPANASGASRRGAIGVAILRRGAALDTPRLIAWMRRGDARRAGYDEADAWAHALAGDARTSLSALLAHPTPEGRALGVLCWSWMHVAELRPRVEALTRDRAPLRGDTWLAHDAPSVRALATRCLATSDRDPMLRLRGCCH